MKKRRVRKPVVKKVEPKKVFKEAPTPESSEYETFLIDKIAKCQVIVEGLKTSKVWDLIRSDYEAASNSLDLSWAFADGTSANFRGMQSAKMASQTFMNMLPNYEHDLKMAMKQLGEFQDPKGVVKRDFDEEGIKEKGLGLKQENAYHG